MNQFSKLLVGAVVTGFLAGQVALANDAAPAAGDEAKAEKASCKGKAGCKGKNKCKGKKAGKNACKGKNGCGGEHHEGEAAPAPAEAGK